MMMMIVLTIGKTCLADAAENSNLEELRLKDPKLWPGHMEPFGSKQTTVDVDTIDYWPNPAGLLIFILCYNTVSLWKIFKLNTAVMECKFMTGMSL